MLSRFVISFSSKKQASSNFMAAVAIHNDFGAEEKKICHCFHFSPFYLPWSDGTGCHLCFLNVEFQEAFSLSSFTLIKRLSRSSSLSGIRVVSSAHLRLLIFLLAVLIPSCDSSSQHGPALFCVGSFWTTDSISLLVISLFKWCIFSLLNFSVLAVCF